MVGGLRVGNGTPVLTDGRVRAMRRRRTWSIALLLVAALLRFWDLGGPSLWYDEAYTWWVGTQVTPAESIVSSLKEFIPPLTYFLWRGWAALTGTSEFALRAASALLGVIAVALAGRLAHRLGAGIIWRSGVPTPAREDTYRPLSGVGLAALTLFAIAPPVLWAAREVRMYGPLLAFTLLAALALVEVMAPRGRRRALWAWVWGAAALAALYTVVLAGFWLVGQGVLMLCALVLLPRGPSRRARVTALVPPAVVVALLYLPWLIPALGHLGENAGYWPGTLTAPTFFERTVRGITVFRFLDSERAALDVGLLVVSFGLLAPILAGRSLLTCLYPLATGVVPLVLMSVVFRRIPKWELQHTVIFAPQVLLALAMAWGLRGDRRGSQVPIVSSPLVAGQRRRARVETGRRHALRLALVVAMLPLGVATVNMLFNPTFAHDDWRAVAGYIRANRAPGEAVIVETGAALPAWAYYTEAGGASSVDAWPEDVIALPDDPLLDVTHVLAYENTAPVLNARLGDATGVWVVGWLDEVTDPTDLVGSLLSEVGEATHVPDFQGVALRHFSLAQTPDFPAVPRVTAVLGEELLPDLQLVGVDLPTAACPADQVITVRSWWSTGDPATHAGTCYQASLRVYDAAGNQWGQRDAPPGGGDYRPERWPAGNLVLGTFDLRLPAGTPIGTYTTTLILYEVSGAGDVGAEGAARSAAVTLGTFQVSRPTTVPEMPEDMVVATAGDDLAEPTPLTLLGARLNRSAVAPCEVLEGWLFWEVDAVEAPPPAEQPGTAYRVRVSVGNQEAEVPLTPDFDLTDWQPGDRFLTQFDLPVGCRALAAETPLGIALVSQAPAATGGDPAGTTELSETGKKTGEAAGIASVRSRVLATWNGPAARIAVQRTFELPPALSGTAIEVGDGMARLVGYSVEPANVDADAPFTLVLYWQALTPTDVPYTVFVHVTPPDAAGPVLAQDDAWPALNLKPTYTWVPGEVIADAHALPPLPAGTYALRVGMYGPDGVRLPLAVDGVTVPDGATAITTLVVK